MTASDGGVFAFGDARFFGAARDRITSPESGRGVVAIVPTKSGAGYWQVAASGKVFAFGDAAGNLGSPDGRLAAPSSAWRPVRPAPSRPPPPTGVIKPLGLPSGPGAAALPVGRRSPPGAPAPREEEKDKAGRALAVAEAGNRVFIGGEFAGLVPPVAQPKGIRAPPRSPPGPTWRRSTSPPERRSTGTSTPTTPCWRWRCPPTAARSTSAAASARSPALRPSHLAAINIETGALDPTFQPPALDDPVKAMALYRQHPLHRRRVPPCRRRGTAPVGRPRCHDRRPAGRGSSLRRTAAATSRARAAARWRAATTAPSTTSASPPTAGILVAGGDFLDFGDRGGLLVVDGATGQPTAWQPTIDRPVHGLTMWPGDNRTFFVATGGSGGQVQAFRILDAVPAVVADIDDDDDDDDDGRRRRRSRRSSEPDDFESESYRAAVGPQDRRRRRGRGGDDRARVPRRALRLRPRRQHGLREQCLRGRQGRATCRTATSRCSSRPAVPTT